MAIDPRVVAAESRRRSASCKTCGDERRIVALAHGTSSQILVLLPATIAWDKLRSLRASSLREQEWNMLVYVYGHPLGRHVSQEFGKRAKSIIDAEATEIHCPDCVTYRVMQPTFYEQDPP